MEKIVEGYLQILISEKCLSKPKEAVLIIEKIMICLKQEKGKSNIDFLIDLILDEHDAIFKFIWKTHTNSDMNQAIVSIFKLLIMLVTDFESLTQTYFGFLFEKCLFLIDTQFGRIKEFSLTVMVHMISAGFSVASDLEALTLKLKKYLHESRKIQGTLLKQIYITLGVLFVKHPDMTRNDAKWFFDNMNETLRRELSGKKLLVQSKVDGAFRGINGYLQGHSLPNPPKSDYIQILYEYIKQASGEEKISHSALEIFQNHWTIFIEYVYTDREYWRRKLTSMQARNQRAFISDTFCAFYKMIANAVKRNPLRRTTAKEFETNFIAILKSTNSTMREKTSALVGITEFVLNDALNEDVDKIYEFVRDLIASEETTLENDCSPLYVECVSALIFKSNVDFCHVERTKVTCLKRLSLVLLNQYPRTRTNFKDQSLAAIEKSLYLLELYNPRILDGYLDEFIYRALLRCCSSSIRTEVDLIGDSSTDLIACKSYTNVWKYLLNLSRTPNLPVDGSQSCKNDVSVKVFDAYVRSFLKILTNLSRLPVSEGKELEPSSNLKIFINLVDLYGETIAETNGESLNKWTGQILELAVRMSYKNPQSTACYKIIRTTLRFGFSTDSPEDVKLTDLMVEFFANSLRKLNRCRCHIQTACLETLFSAPACMVRPLLDKMGPVLRVALYHGRGHRPLLEDLVTALDNWNGHLTTAEFDGILGKVLPDLTGLLDVGEERHVESGDDGTKDDFKILQKRLLVFLGNLEMRTVENMLKNVQDGESDYKKLTDVGLIYSMPSSHDAIKINLDEMVPRIVELCLSCGDRTTRMAACEVFHSVVVILLANVNQLNGGFSGPFDRIVRTCFSLSCDSDSVVRRIFEPFALQIVRFFAGKKATYFADTRELLEILLDCATRPYNSVEREFSALLLSEFCLCCVRYQAPEDPKTVPENVSRVLDELATLSLHTDDSKRLGAAVIFNKLLPVIVAEEENAFDGHFFQLYYNFLQGARLYHGMEDAEPTLRAIELIKAQLIARAEVFNEFCPSRILPPEFDGGLLENVVKWTFSLITDKNSGVRKMAMELVDDLVPVVKDCHSLSAFVRKHRLAESLGVHLDSPKDLRSWLNYHAAIFDRYAWFLHHNLVECDDQVRSLVQHFATGLLSSQFTADVENEKRGSVLTYLNFLTSAIGNDGIFATAEVWETLKICTFAPNRFGLGVDSERLIGNLLDIFRFHSGRMDFGSDLNALFVAPCLEDITRNRFVDTRSEEYLFSLKILHGFGTSKAFAWTERIENSLNGKSLFWEIFNSLFYEEETACFAITLEPSCQAYLEELLKLANALDVADVLSGITNREEVKVEETGTTTTKGSHFRSYFGRILLDLLNVDQLLDKMTQGSDVEELKCFLAILENNATDSAKKKLCEEIIRRWSEFRFNCEPYLKDVLLRLTVRLADIVGTPGVLKNSKLEDLVYDADLRQGENVQMALHLLPYLSEYGEIENVKLRHQLEKLASGQCAGKSNLVTALLKSLRVTGSTVVLRCVATIPDLSRHNDEIKTALSVYSELPERSTREALKLLYAVCFGGQISTVQIMDAYDTFLEPLLNLLPNTRRYEFIIGHLEEICDILTIQPDGMNADANIEMKMCAAKMVQNLFGQTDTDLSEAMSKDKKDLINKTIKNSFHLLRHPKDFVSDDRRKLTCEIFKMICSVLCPRVTDEKFYKLYLFNERWSFLDGTVPDRMYDFEMDFNEIPKRKSIITHLRKVVASDTSANVPLTLNYLQDDTLFSSSLEEDVTKFDFTHQTIRSRPVSSCAQVRVNLEMDELNQHECMATLVAVIFKMVEIGITAPPAPDENSTYLPCWLRYFLSVLDNPNAPFNLKLFVLKALYNVQELLQPYGRVIFKTVLNAVWQISIGSKLNYFVIDSIEMIAKLKCLPEDDASRMILVKLASMVITKSSTCRRDLLGYNLEVVKLVIETWKDVLSASDFHFVLERLTDITEDATEDSEEAIDLAHLYIQVCGVLLWNGMEPWTRGSEEVFFRLMSEYLRRDGENRGKCAEVCGLALAHLEKTNVERVDEQVNFIRESVGRHVSDELLIIYGIHRHYPKMVSFFVYQIVTSAWNKTDSYAFKMLEMLRAYSVESSGTAEAVVPHGLLVDKLRSADVGVQEITLQIVHNVLDRMEDDHCEMLVREVIQLRTSSNADVRKWVCEISGKYRLRKKKNDGLAADCRVVLLEGLNAPELEETCLKFWTERLREEVPSTRLLDLLEEFYSPETERMFLGTVIRALTLSNGVERKMEEPIFPHAIVRDVRFESQNFVPNAEHTSTLLTNREHAGSSTSGTLSYSNAGRESRKVLDTPLKRRKSSTRVNCTSTKWRKEQNATTGTCEREHSKVNVHGVYKLGDYPNIQIGHCQILKPLAALARRDSQIARQFLVSYYNGVLGSVDSTKKAEYFQRTSKCMETIMKFSPAHDPAVIGFVFQVLLTHCAELDVDVELVARCAASTNLTPLGALVVEKIIAKEEAKDVKLQSKRLKGMKNTRERTWMALAGLYRHLEETDVTFGIVLDKVEVAEEAKRAIEHERQLDWASASNRYRAILMQCDPNGGPEMEEFYTQSYLWCLLKLADWSSLQECIESSVEENLEDIWQNYHLASLFLKSSMLTSLHDGDAKFKSITDEFIRDKTKLELFTENFQEELIVHSWLSQKYVKAVRGIDRFCWNFLDDWSRRSRWCENLNLKKLRTLQCLAELDRIVKIASGEETHRSDGTTHPDAERWNKIRPMDRDDLMIWDVKLSYRRRLLEEVKNSDLERSIVRSQLALIEASHSQNNLSLARKYLNLAKNNIDAIDEDSRIEWNFLDKMHEIRSSLPTVHMSSVDSRPKVIDRVTGEISVGTTDSDAVKIRAHKWNLLSGKLLSRMLPIATASSPADDNLENLQTDADDLIANLKKKIFEHLETAKNVAESLSAAHSLERSESYLELAKFLLNFSDLKKSTNVENLGRCLLRSMALGNDRATEIFGRLLILPQPDDVEDCKFLEIWQNESDAVPTWSFLTWINQILAFLDSPLYPFLKGIVSRIALTYPNALRYPLKLHVETRNPANVPTRAFIQELNENLARSGTHERFLTSVEFLASPSVIASFHFKNLLAKVSGQNWNYSEAKFYLSRVHHLMFSPELDEFRGPIFKCWRTLKEPIEVLMALESDQDAWTQQTNLILSKVSELKLPSRKMQSSLRSYSPWLYNFHMLKMDAALEVPGRYSGQREPTRTNQVLVSSFRPDVLVVNSKRRTMRLTVVGSDAVERKFLLKFSEDLRQDERIQQVFGHFNCNLEKNRTTAHIRLRTYGVTPLKLYAGMIEWVENTCSLYDMMVKALGENGGSVIEDAQVQHLNRLGARPGDLNVYHSVDREWAVSKFNQTKQSFPEGLLKTSLLRLSSSPEHFTYLRRNFLVSYGATCISHWIVGIGDRHLQNTLVSGATGQILGIDFGCAFGFATQFLSPPELTPFRLTPQILNLANPFGVSGWIKETMIKCLKSFHGDKLVLSAILEAFVVEPVTDWTEKARRSDRYEEEGEPAWHPNRKVDIVTKKLSGVNPVAVFEEDLKAGHGESRYLSKYLETVRGDKQQNVRAKANASGLTAEEQVECLMDLATDPHVLAKTYVGWNPWL